MPKPEILSRVSANKLKVVERIKNGKPGDFISYAELSDLIGVSAQEGSGYQSTYRARQYVIREFGVVWHPSYDHKGLKCLTPKEITILGEKDRKKINRAAGKGLRRLNTVDHTKLPQDQMLKHVATVTHLRLIQQVSARRKRDKLEAACTNKPMSGKEALKLLASSLPKEKKK